MSTQCRRYGRSHLLATLLIVAACAIVLAPSARASAAVSSNATPGSQAVGPYSPGLHMAASPAFGCPATGAVCYYDSQNFKNVLGYMIPSSCSGTYSLDPFRNRVESIRNRTGCGIYLLYYCGTTTCWDEWMRPGSEDGTIGPLNAIDAVRFS